MFFIFFFIQFLGRKKAKKHTLVAKFITKKTANLDVFSWQTYLKDCWSQILVILLTTIGYILVSIYLNINLESIFALLGLYFFINMPLFCYVVMYFSAWIKVKIGFDSSSKEYHFERHDFRYQTVIQTKLWHKQYKLSK